ncbi:MAG: hypothetical protein AAGK32_14795, partial [Actinomycetota bacterium]
TRVALEEMCADHGVPLDVVLPSDSSLLAADRRGEPLDREAAAGVWAAIGELVDRLQVETAASS